MNNNFDKEFASIEKNVKRGFKAWLFIVILSGLTSVALLCTIVYVIAHFLAKVW